MSHALPRAVALAVLLALGWPAATAEAQPREGTPAGTGQPSSPSRGQATAPRPDRTTASYGDWVLRCEVPSAGGEQSCEVAQTILDQRGQALVQIVARRGAPTAQLALSVQVPAHATVSEPLRLGVDAQTALVLSFRRCVPRGCFAEARSPYDDLASLARRGDAGKVEYRDGDGGALSVSVSFRGLAASVDALRAIERG